MDKRIKKCNNCSWYEPHHKNAGFCINSKKFLEGINTGIYVCGNNNGCEDHDLVVEEEVAV